MGTIHPLGVLLVVKPKGRQESVHKQGGRSPFMNSQCDPDELATAQHGLTVQGE